MNNSLFLTFAAITGLFILLLIVKSVGKWNFCVLCAGVSLTWLTLLGLYWGNVLHDTVTLILLIGNSIVGIYYLVEKKVEEKFYIFRLPFFLTLLLFGYELITFTALLQILYSLLLLASLWLLSGIIFAYRNSPSFRKMASALLACCRNW